MKLRTPTSYFHFTCLADKCPDTCCSGWEVVVDEAAQKRYESVTGSMGQRLKDAMITDADGDVIFKNKGRHCPFLNTRALCDIYSTLGEGALCHTCRLYPRFYADYGELREAGLSLSCPEATRMIFSQTSPLSLITTETNAVTEIPESDIDTPLLNRLLTARDTAITLMQNRTLPFRHRLALLLDFSTAFTRGFFAADPGAEATLFTHYALEKNAALRLEVLKNNGASTDTSLFTEIFKLLKGCEYRQSAFSKQALAYMDDDGAFDFDAFETAHKDQLYYYEHLVVLYLFRYFPEALWSYEPLLAIQHAVFAATSLYGLAHNAAKIKKRALTPAEHQFLFIGFSREIEHSIPNMEHIDGQLVANPAFSAPKLMAFLLA